MYRGLLPSLRGFEDSLWVAQMIVGSDWRYEIWDILVYVFAHRDLYSLMIGATSTVIWSGWKVFMTATRA